jgi:hypothetical protein
MTFCCGPSVICEQTNLEATKAQQGVDLHKSVLNLFTECVFIGSVIGARHLGAELLGFRPAVCAPPVTHYRARSRIKIHGRAQRAPILLLYYSEASCWLHLTAFYKP